MIIVSAPSGAGKSSFLDRVLKDFPILKDTITYTTRTMRTGESDGNPYYFVSKEKFLELKEQGFFVESAKVHDNFYGTPLHQIEDAMRENRVVIMDVDVKGAATFKKKYPDEKWYPSKIKKIHADERQRIELQKLLNNRKTS